MGWHRNHAISHSPNQNFFEDTFVSHPGGPNEQFGTHEKLSWGGGGGGGGGVQGNLNWMPGYRIPGEVCGQNICYHVAAFVIPFNLICMTVF